MPIHCYSIFSKRINILIGIIKKLLSYTLIVHWLFFFITLKLFFLFYLYFVGLFIEVYAKRCLFANVVSTISLFKRTMKDVFSSF